MSDPSQQSLRRIGHGQAPFRSRDGVLQIGPDKTKSPAAPLLLWQCLAAQIRSDITVAAIVAAEWTTPNNSSDRAKRGTGCDNRTHPGQDVVLRASQGAVPEADAVKAPQT
jgi:hypothetical protein